MRVNEVLVFAGASIAVRLDTPNVMSLGVARYPPTNQEAAGGPGGFSAVGVSVADQETGSFARWRCMAALRERLTRPWRSISVTTTMTSSPTDTTSSTVGTW